MSHPHSPRRLTRTRFAALSVAVGVAAGSLTGCSAGSDPGTTKLSFFSWDSEAEMAPVIDAFEAENPDITIEFSSAPPVAEYVSTLQTRLVSGTAADVFVIAAENKVNLIKGGFVKDLTDEPYMDAASPFNTETYGEDGRAYGLSISSWAGGVLYNEALLDDAGITEFPTDWDGFLDALTTLKESGVTPIYDSASSMPLGLAALVGSENARLGGDMDKKIFSGEATFGDLWEGPLTEWSQLFSEGLMTSDVISLSGDQIADEFVNGRVAMMTAGPWNVPGIRDVAPDMAIKFAPVPSTDGEPFWAGAASPGYAINSKTKNEEAAQKFLAFLGSAEGVEAYQTNTDALTTTSNYTPVIDEALDPNLEGLKEGHFYLPQIAWPNSQDVLNTEAVAQIQLLAQGQITPAQVAEALDARLAAQQN